MDFDYQCTYCGWKPSENYQRMICCKCGGEIKGESSMVMGTRDQFGIKKEFYDPKTKQYINTRSKWEKAGYRDPFEANKDSNVKDGIKRKIDRINFDKGKRKVTVGG